MRERFVASHELRDSRKVGRRFDFETWRQRQTVEFLERGNAVGFFLRFLALGNGLAKTARVFAVEGADNGLRNREGLKVPH